MKNTGFLYWVLKNLQNSMPCHTTLFSVKLDYQYFAEENLAHPWYNLRTCTTHR